jgi:hypothetical protein
MRRNHAKPTPPTISKPFKVWFGCLGNGVTVCNSAATDPETKDFPVIAHINKAGIITWYEKPLAMPPEARAAIERKADAGRGKWLAYWSSESPERKYGLLLDWMTCAELAGHMEWRREGKEPQRGIPWLIEQTISRKACARAAKIYGLEGAKA